jgi:enoyl-CoA hydratase
VARSTAAADPVSGPRESEAGEPGYGLDWHDDGLAEIHLTCGKANALNARSLAAITAAFDEAARRGATGVVLTGYDCFFSAGLDLVTLYELDRAEMDAFVQTFEGVMLRVFAFPRPVVAAVSGHAVAGGCVLALACDARIAVADGIRIGLNEVRLGLPFPASALEIVRYAVPGPAAEAVLYGGALYGPAEALAAGLVTGLAPGDALGEARAACRRLAGGPSDALATVKASLRQPALERAHGTLDRLREAFVDAWFSPEGRRRIGEARIRLKRD